MPEFTLRPMVPTDGPAIDALIREEAQTTSISMTTSYRHDVYRSLLAQHPSTLRRRGRNTRRGRPGRVRDRVRRWGHRGRTALSDRASREPQGPRRPPPAGPRRPPGRVADRGGREAVRRRGSGDGRDRVEQRSLDRDRAALGEPDRRSGQPADRPAVRHASAGTRAGRSAPPRRRRRGGPRRASQPSTPATTSSRSSRPAVSPRRLPKHHWANRSASTASWWRRTARSWPAPGSASGSS